jgi:predicted dehydrogenase
MSGQIPVGVIGTSRWADMMHLPCLKSHPHAYIAAICGRNRDRANEMAKKYEIPFVFTDYQEMIEKGNLEAIVIVTPEDLHYPMTMHALNAGLHIMCEKPLALNAKQAKEMYEKAESIGVKHMVMFTHRWWPHIEFLKKLIDGGYLGRCYHCDIRLLYEYARDTKYRWKFDRKRSNGVLGGLGSHMIDWARLFVGDIARVSAHLATFSEHSGPDDQILDPANDSALLAIEFENDAHGVIYTSYVPYLGNRRYEINITLHGQSGTIEVFFSALGADVYFIRDDKKKFELKTFSDYLLGDIDQADISPMFKIFTKLHGGDHLFIDSILEDRPAVPNFYDGLEVQKVIDAAEQSHQSGRWVSLK